MMGLSKVIHSPLLTEKSSVLKTSLNQYFFKVACAANKEQIRRAVESLFGVVVKDVRTLNYRGKEKRFGMRKFKKSNWKKAVVTLKNESKIQLFDEF